MFMEYTHWRSDARLVKNYIDKSADTISWLQDMGVEFQGAFRYFPQSEATWHIVKSSTGMGPRAASAMIKMMTGRAEELGVQIMLNTRATEIKKAQDGSVNGLAIITADGNDALIECDAVVLATGGFGDNPEMIKKELGYELGKDLFSIRVPGIVGDGINMARRAGAAVTQANIELIYNCPTHSNYKCLDAVHRQPNLFVNLMGERFINEEIVGNTTFTANAISLQKESCGISIIDDSIVAKYMKSGMPYISLVTPNVDANDYYSDIKQAVETNDRFFAQADSIEELEKKLDIPTGKLVETVREYNEYCKTNDKLFGKRVEYMLPLIGAEILCP